MTDKQNSAKVKLCTPQSLVLIDSSLESTNVKRNTIVSAKVICWDSAKKGMLVIFGNQLRGFIPEEHISIYPSTDKHGIPSEATYIFGKNIIAEVIDYNHDKTLFTLSRVNTMKKRLQEIKPLETVSACITNVRAKDIFMDLGCGIIGRAYFPDITKCYVEDLSFLGYHEGSIADFQIINIQDNKCNLSRRNLYPEYDISKIVYGDIVKAKIVSELPATLGCEPSTYTYSVEINENANFNGIIDTFIPLTKGSIVTCSIRNATEKGVRLNLLSI